MDGASTTGKQTHNRLNPVKLPRAFGKITESSDPVLDICVAFKTRILYECAIKLEAIILVCMSLPPP